MKTARIHLKFCSAAARRRMAFTLPELLIAMTIFLILVAGIVAANIYGLEMFQITMTKLTATAGVRKAMGRMTDEIRTGNTISVGDVSNGIFVGHINGEPQIGTGLLISSTTNTAPYTLYFVNAADLSFRRTAVSSDVTVPTVTEVLASQVTNSDVFCAQDYLGNVLTNNQNNRVIRLRLDIFEAKRHGTLADHYLLETCVTRRAP
jgi:prepilin-type N-terminal cleavage/methylation domain-containing protein